ncbi:hypothetical protein RCO28_16760 [Streptomyces sp. LHD-70]|uniref:NucA/NucB deoxyribonuclease domain-containing protein n=1 Tax=Streptomyces sp. LHD-70 TaxID=3072140 RepID=UPI002810164E|nr:hypothetical protein [Streptomyces sp. LHD-70]MDQ8704125.1 hypothetical protein [Streptomyces sp. LHD-70]
MAAMMLGLLVAGCQSPAPDGQASDDKASAPRTAPLGGVKLQKAGARLALRSAISPRTTADCSDTAGGKSRAANCISFDTKATPTDSHDIETKTVTAASDGACALTRPGQSYYLRQNYCYRDTTMTYTQINTRTGRPLGTGTFKVSGSIQLSSTQATWTENVTVAMIKGSRAVRSLNIGLSGTCSGSCTMVKKSAWSGAKTLRPGGRAATGSMTYRLDPAKGESLKTTVGTRIHVNQRGDLPIRPNISWNQEHMIRCDRAVGAGAGCVYPSVKARFELSAAKYKAAAFTYAWAIDYMTGQNWGKGLRRMADEKIADTWRKRICRSGPSPFKRMPQVVPNDSCDEFPFASTYESGGSKTINSKCADVIPKWENGDWIMYPESTNKPVRRDAPCVRSHVTRPD